MKTAELAGAALDWAVAKCEGLNKDCGLLFIGTQAFETQWNSGERKLFCPSTDWEQGGLIIEKLAGFELKIWLESNPETRCETHIHNNEGNWIAFGPTPLVAAMRCYVASKLGVEIEIPKEIT